jgi:hypothetical protein
VLAGCAKPDLNEPPADLGPFQLGVNVAVADNMQKVPISREATADEWEAGLTKAVADRFGYPRYSGDRLYNIGINVDGYALAPPGVPVVAAPRSVVAVSANVFLDAQGNKRLNAKPKQLIVLESLSPESVIGTGYTSTREEQIEALSYNVAKAVEGWFLDNPQWFDPAGAVPDPPAKDKGPAPAPQVFTGAPAPAAADPVTTSPLPAPAAAPDPAAVRRPLARPQVLAPASQ